MLGGPKKYDEERSNLIAISGLGLEFAGSIVGMVLVGWGIDALAGTGRLWTMILGIVGIIGGGYNFLKRARMYMKAQERAYREKQDAKSRDRGGPE